jgi:hypothetical protein
MLGNEEDSMNARPNSVGSEVTRRTFLAAGVASAALAAGGSAFAQQSAPAQQAPRVKGPAVWLDMDQAELDAAYDQIKYAPNLPQLVKRYATNSEAVRARLGAPRRYAYGPSPIETLDVYMTKRANAPVNIFIHGGAWRGGLAKESLGPPSSFTLTSSLARGPLDGTPVIPIQIARQITSAEEPPLRPVGRHLVACHLA